jgi:N-acyl-D-amino-acid deacylase
MAIYDLLLKNGTVVDGTGAPRFQANIAIIDGKIVEMGDVTGEAKEEVDASGMIVAPGAVDHHTHYDAQIFRDPTCADGGQNGVTSVVMTNCGFGFAPCRKEHQDRYMVMMENVEQIPVAHQRASLPWDWQTFPEFLASLDRTDKAVNAMAYVPLNALFL